MRDINEAVDDERDEDEINELGAVMIVSPCQHKKNGDEGDRSGCVWWFSDWIVVIYLVIIWWFVAS